MTRSMAIPELEKAWGKTCRILLGQEIGPLQDYQDWLKTYIDPISLEKSAISGKDVVVSSEKFCDRARFISHDEVSEYGERMRDFKLDMNAIKDIDSILDATQENFYYVGNVVLGDSRATELCHRCINTSFALECQDMYDGKYIAFCSSVKSAEYAFGASGGGELQFGIQTLEVFRTTRCFETLRCYTSFDCYYSANIEGCNNCMFCFNLRSKSNMIGNLQLSKEKYSTLKGKLIDDIADRLKSRKSVPTIVDVINGDSA